MGRESRVSQNFLVVLLDDHARWALGCYGNSEIHSPSLNYLAETGARMDNAFTPTPVCSPARACFMTGRLPSQHGVHDYLDPEDPETNEREWLADEQTLPEILKANGYTTALCGKWHLGAPIRRVFGFDYWYEQERPGGVATTSANGSALQREEVGSSNPHSLADRAIEFLRHRDRGRPFFLFVGLQATHSPWVDHPERLVSHYRTCTFEDIPRDTMFPFGRLAAESLIPTRGNPREAWAQYYAAVSEIDEQVGRLVDELDDQGIRGETLFVYTSDHGLNLGHHGLWGKGNGSKPYNMLEESIRIPLILNQPGRTLGGLVRAEAVTHCDSFATILDYANVELPNTGGSTPYPGRSYRALVEGGMQQAWPENVFGEYGNLRMVRTPRYKLVTRHPDGPNELFDLFDDPRETLNLYNHVAHHAIRTQLEEEIATYYSRYDEAAKSGLRVDQLPRHNAEEIWRNPDADNRWWEHTHPGM